MSNVDRNLTQQALFNSIQKGDPAQASKAEDLLARLNDHLVKAIVGKVKKLHPIFSPIPNDDLYQSGRIGLLQAIRKFKPEKGNRFITYAWKPIKREVFRGIRDWLGARYGVWEAWSTVQEARQDLKVRLGRKPTIEELAACLNITPEEVRELFDAQFIYFNLSSFEYLQEYLEGKSSDGPYPVALPLQLLCIEEGLEKLGKNMPRLYQTLCYVLKGYSEQEIANRLNCKINSVRVNQSRGITHFLRYMEEMEAEEC